MLALPALVVGVAAAAAAAPGVLGPHASPLQLKPCGGANADAQSWQMPSPGETGLIVDDATGRCVSVLDCALPNVQPQLQVAQMGVAVLDVCGSGSSCGGNNQQWTNTASPGRPGQFNLVSAMKPGADPTQPWKLMGTFDPKSVDVTPSPPVFNSHLQPPPHPPAASL